MRKDKTHLRDGEWYLEELGSQKILAGSRNLGSIFDKSQNLVFAWFGYTFFESRTFLPKSLGLGFLTRISASRWVSDFTIRYPSFNILPNISILGWKTFRGKVVCCQTLSGNECWELWISPEHVQKSWSDDFVYYQNKIISYTFDLKSQQVYNTLQNQRKESIKLIHLV